MVSQLPRPTPGTNSPPRTTSRSCGAAVNDLRAETTELRTGVTALRGGVTELRTELRGESTQIRGALIQQRGEFRNELGDLEVAIARPTWVMVTGLVAAVGVTAGVVTAL